MYLWAFWIFWHFGFVLFNVESDLFQQSAGCLISWRPQPVVHTHKPLSSGLDSHTVLQASMVVSSLEEALVHVSTHDSQSVPVTLLLLPPTPLLPPPHPEGGGLGNNRRFNRQFSIQVHNHDWITCVCNEWVIQLFKKKALVWLLLRQTSGNKEH